MERLQFIVRETNKLLGTSYNLLSFDALATIDLLHIVNEVLQVLGASSEVEGSSSTAVTRTILSALQSIKYMPPGLSDVNSFYDGFALGEIGIIYPVLEWLLRTQTKIKKRVYLAKYADKLPIPTEAVEDPEVMQYYRNYEMIIDEFWAAYKEDSVARKECVEAAKLQTDIIKMNQEIKNLTQKNRTQWEKLDNVSDKENLLFLGKNYRVCITEQINLTKQVKENLESVANLEFQIKNLEDKWLRRVRYPMTDTDVIQIVQEEAQVNKIFLESQLLEELFNEGNLALVLERSVDNSSPSREILYEMVATAKNEVQSLMNRKLSLYANTEDKLGPFRKQSSAIAQKKLEISNDIKDNKIKIARIVDTIREKEATLFNVVGGEILHGDELKRFIAILREKSVTYKRLRGQLQSLSSEQGILSRSLDVLKTVDPTIEDAFFDANATVRSEFLTEFSSNTSDAKQICKDFMQDIDDLKIKITHTHEQLASTKEEVESINRTMDSVKDIFENATSTVAEEISRLKGEIREMQNDIDLSEKTWKATARSLDKSEYIFNRLIDEMIDEPDSTALKNDSYLTTLTKKKDENQLLLLQTQELVEKLEESKREERETIEFYKHAEFLILQKFDDNE
ncbi:hypothetical protein Trydic_g3615 [Trypoxylus dichotomus]